MSQKYLFFYGHNKVNKNGYLSNFYLSEFTDENGQKFDCVERYMHYRKALLFKDEKAAKHILSVKTAAQTKAWGRKVKDFDINVWNKHKKQIVKDGLKLKFSQNLELREKLVNTEEFLLESSPIDNIWGIGFTAKDAMANKDKWGQNLLGICLMEMREEMS